VSQTFCRRLPPSKLCWLLPVRREVSQLATVRRRHVTTHSKEARHWLRIATSVYPTCTRHSHSGDFHRNITITTGIEKLEWFGFGEKNLKIRLLVLTEFMNVTDGRTDRHRTTTQSCTCIVARSDNNLTPTLRVVTKKRIRSNLILFTLS